SGSGGFAPPDVRSLRMIARQSTRLRTVSTVSRVPAATRKVITRCLPPGPEPRPSERAGELRLAARAVAVDVERPPVRTGVALAEGTVVGHAGPRLGGAEHPRQQPVAERPHHA